MNSLQEEKVEFYAVTPDNTLVGFIQITFEDRHGSIALLAVDPAFQRKGIGSLLLSYGLDFLERQWIHDVSVYARPMGGVPLILAYERRLKDLKNFI